MLLRKDVLARIAAGEITLAFRKWRRPTVTAGGQLKTAIGVLAIQSVGIVDAGKIKAADAKRAGYDSLAALHTELSARSDGAVYRIAFERLGDDPRIALREISHLTGADIEILRAQLDRYDRAGANGAWTRAILNAIAAQPGTRAGELAALVGLDTPSFKRNVRKLKELGLTESLGTGYRLAPRGQALMKALSAKAPRPSAPRGRAVRAGG